MLLNYFALFIVGLLQGDDMIFSWPGLLVLLGAILLIAYVTFKKESDIVGSTLENTLRRLPITILPIVIIGSLLWWAIGRTVGGGGGVPFRFAAQPLLYLALTSSLLVILLRICLLNPMPLRHVVGVLVNRPLTIPVYVTVAREESGFDPDDPSYEQLDPDRPLHHAVRKSFYLPDYVRLNCLDSTDATNAVLASAALPFSLVAPVRVRGKQCMDGGLVDNTPLYPLIYSEHCDELMVVHNSPEHGNSQGSWPAKYLLAFQIIARLYKVAEYAIDREWFTFLSNAPYKKAGDNPKVIPYEQPVFWPSAIYDISPSQKMGPLLRFSGRYLQELLELGKKDAEAFISHHEDWCSRRARIVKP
jgi:hypothetical protein